MLRGFVKKGVKPSAGWKEFNPKSDFSAGLGDPVRKYEKSVGSKTTNVHYGQMKLAVAEMMLFTYYWDPKKIPNPHIVYVGSANGVHIKAIADLFPWFTWDLYDPRPHSVVLNDNPKIAIHEEYFTDEIAKKYTGRDDIIFISDIRGVEGKEFGLRKGSKDRDIEEFVSIHSENMEQQMNWVYTIRPQLSSLKFRLPYSWKVVTAKGTTRTYLTGTILKQPWAPKSSTETRLIVPHDLNQQEWDLVVNEELMFYHNTVTRFTDKYLNPFDKSQTPIEEKLGLLNDYDSVATTITTMDYLRKVGKPPNKANTLAVVKYLIDHSRRDASDQRYLPGELSRLRLLQ